jgi:NADP-dependent 3-hydroxy acid dehydrogenase YdfG
LARQFAAKGATLTLVARGTDALNEVARETGGRALTCDLTDRAAI